MGKTIAMTSNWDAISPILEGNEHKSNIVTKTQKSALTLEFLGRPLSTQFLPFSGVVHFTKSSLSAYRGFLIKADRQETTQLRTFSQIHS